MQVLRGGENCLSMENIPQLGNMRHKKGLRAEAGKPDLYY